jgi:hypothetical protein
MLVLRPDPNSLDVHHVMHGGWEVGRIDKSLIATRLRWIWALNRVPGGPDGLRLTGVTDTIDEAEVELAKSWKQWLEWAGLVAAETIFARIGPAPAIESPKKD